MADKKHLSLIGQGVVVWNQWRKGNPIGRPDLRGANLSLANLSGANLFQVDLRGADLSRANLSRADLSGANLRWASLFQADLSSANLRWANVGWSIFGNVDLSQVKGLKSIHHEGPSTIGIDTIYLSKGNIPEEFLRGAGVPDQFIAYVKALVGTAIEYYSAFISYSHNDEEFTRRLFADLQNNNVRTWYAPEDLKIGEKFRQRIDESIRLHDKLLLVLSQDSVTSDWVEFEVEAALAKETEKGGDVLFPVRVDDAIMHSEKGWAAHIKRTRHIGDFSHWKNHDTYKVALQRLLRDLKAADKDQKSAS